MNLILLVGIVFGLCLVICGSEFILRWIFRRGSYRVWTPSERREFSFDREILPELGDRAQVFFNREGERGAEPPRFGSFYRIIAAGGSCAECWYLDHKATWPMQLQEALSHPDSLQKLGAKRVHVGNVGRSLVDSSRLATLLGKIVPQHKSVDAVVIMCGLSDIVNWMSAGSLPQCKTDSPAELKRLFSVYPEQSFQMWPIRKWAITEAAIRLTRPFMPVEKYQGAGKTVAKLRKMRKEALEIRDEAPDATNLFAHFEDNLRKSIAVCQKAGAKVVIAGQPMVRTKDLSESQANRLWNGGIGDVHNEKVSVYYSTKCIARLLEELGHVARMVAEDTGAIYVDVQKHLDDTASAFYDDSHFTPEGARSVAKAIAQGLVQDYK